MCNPMKGSFAYLGILRQPHPQFYVSKRRKRDTFESLFRSKYVCVAPFEVLFADDNFPSKYLLTHDADLDYDKTKRNKTNKTKQNGKLVYMTTRRKV